ncbi:MAG: ABC transporter substrate-binding protein [Okeania sp. SIO3I5]|uniref:ABC transporter substrate-binding protein n=1 Tax=Okeania sp. SIO3I5 TaxID=2607805 RepID=UPI0013B793CE|nr:ABC transporter substrate-binding protein [Okeania sp. SIO3I5]NEQ38088.1 ABC transporter substrate-binding protein [Okeania sp. SIO3I5]
MILSTNRKNPYIIGHPIYEKESFFGRDSLFNFIDANLNNGAKVILLQGQRRIGKSSFLYQIPNFVGGDNFVFVYFDLQYQASLTLAEVLEKLAIEIIRNIQPKPDNIKPPLKTDLEANTEIFSEIFLPQVFENLGGKNLVLLLDEFDVLSNYNPASAIEHFFPYLQSIILNRQQLFHEQLFIIAVVGRRLDDLKNLLNLFAGAPNQEIGLLDRDSAIQLITQSRHPQLITKPVEGVLEYQPDAIAAILELSAGHPYFTQAICFQIFQQAQAEAKWQVSSADVNKMIVDRAIESAEGGLTWFRDGLPIPERVIFSAVAEAQRIAMKYAELVQEPLTLLKEYGVVPTESLFPAADRLVKWGFLDAVESSDLSLEKVPRYRVKIELVRRWLLKRYSLRGEIQELENLISKANRIYKLATDLHEESVTLTSLIPLYKEVLEINPNHFQALFDLAEGYLEAEDFSKAVECYQRGYEVNPIQTEDGLVESLLGYGQKLMEQRKWEIAKEQFEKVLNLDPDNILAQEKLIEIKRLTEVKRFVGSTRNRRNPYIIGRSIDEPELFFGRESLFRFIEDNLSNNQQVILLHGQRRTGKSSVLQQIPKKVNLDNKFVFILSDFQDQGQWSLHQIIYKLTQEICEQLGIDANTIGLASIQNLEKDPNVFRALLHPIFHKLGSRNLVLLLDGFDVLNSNNNDSWFEDFFRYLQQILYEESQLFIIPVVGRRLSDMPKLLELFKNAPHLRIGLLDEFSIQRLITRPTRGSLRYTNKAIEKILKLSAGHPYFTQAICYALFAQAREQEKDQILETDVGKVLDDAIELSEAGLIWFREGLLISERVVFSAAAEAQEIAMQKNQSLPENPLKLLKSIGVDTDKLHHAQQTLIENEFLDADGNRVTVEFVRHWFVKYYPLKSEIWELEKLDNEANYYYERANKWENQGNINDELYHYAKALELNPNHFSALFRLAEAYLKSKKYQEALELYERAYKINPQRAKKDYIESLFGYGNYYFQNSRLLHRDLSSVKKLYEKVLEIDPENTDALDRLKYFRDKEKPRKVPTPLLISAALAVPLLVGIATFLRPIVPDILPGKTFSSGENTLFSETNDESYSRIISTCNQEFQEKNYDEAANCFEELAQKYRNQPEPLIYYNNSLALSYGNPLTIAVAVPADKNQIRAKSVLRGVAQAQNEYNETELQNNSSQNTNIRLLEIVIANDSNSDEISPKLAQEIVKNKDILGVIGHNDSSVSKAALEVYEQKGLAMITSSSTSTELKGDVFFRTNINNLVLSQKLADYVQDIGIEKVMVFYNEQNSFSRNIKEFFDYYFTSLNPENQVEFEDSKGQYFDAKEAVIKAVDSKFQAAMLFPDIATIDQAISIAKANYQLPEKQRLKLFDTTTLYDCATLNQGKQAVKGLILAVPWHKELDNVQAFLDRAKAQWGGAVDWRTATSYDATQAFIGALSNSGDNPTRAKVLEELKQVNILPEETSSGQNLRFNPDGEITREAILVEVVESPNQFCSNLDFRLVKE